MNKSNPQPNRKQKCLPMEWICLQTMQQMNMMEGRNFKWSVLSNHWQTGEPFWTLPVCLQGDDRFIWSSFHARKYEQQWDHRTCRRTNECISIRLKQRLCEGAHSLQDIYVCTGQVSIKNAEHRVETQPAICLPYCVCSFVSHFTNDKLWRGAFFFPRGKDHKGLGTKMNQQRSKSLSILAIESDLDFWWHSGGVFGRKSTERRPLHEAGFHSHYDVS